MLIHHELYRKLDSNRDFDARIRSNGLIHFLNGKNHFCFDLISCTLHLFFDKQDENNATFSKHGMKPYDLLCKDTETLHFDYLRI